MQSRALQVPSVSHETFFQQQPADWGGFKRDV
jgi:hypothetical protein